MGIIKGALSVRRYKIADTIEVDRENLIARMNEFAFREPASKLSKEDTSGWCSAHNLLDTEFDNINQWLYNSYAVFALRVDKKTVPARLFKAHLEKRKQAWCQENGRERCPIKVKEELKELLEAELLAKTLPHVATYEVAWDIVNGWVIVHSGSDLVNDKIRNLFFKTFGVRLDAADEEKDTAAYPHLDSDFYLWLWHRSEVGQGSLEDANIDFWVQDRLSFRVIGEDKASAVLSGDPAHSPEAKAALVGGKIVKDIRIGLRRDDREYAVSLRGKDIAGAKLPALVKGGDVAEVIYERMFLYEELNFLLETLFSRFFELRSSDDWENSLRDWPEKDE